jgi:hypothetical protein
MIGRNAVCAAAGTVLAISLAACGGGGGSGKQARGSASSSGDTRLTAEQVISTVSQNAGRVESFEARLSSDTAASGQKVSMAAVISSRVKPEPAMRLNITHMTVNGQEGGGFEEILLGDDLYMKTAAVPERNGGRPWVRMSLRKIGAQGGIDPKSLMNQSKQADPSANARMLTASRDVRRVGTETVNGASTTHYQGTYSLREALARLGGDQRAAMQQLTAQIGLDQMAFDLWIDDRRLPRKMTLRTPAGSQVRSITTVTYRSFNRPVSISAPPASQVRSAG